MPLSKREQQQIQMKIDTATKEELSEMRTTALTTLMVNKNYRGGKRFSKEDEEAVEILTRLEATEEGKGSWFRMKRRLQLTKEHS
jgi:hypothetical protein